MFRANAQSLFFLLVLFCFKANSDSTDSIDLNGTINNKSEIREYHFSAFEAPVFQNSYTRPILMTFLLLVATFSVLSNTLIIHVVKANQHLQISINFLIVNMACGDLMATTVAAPLTIYYLYRGNQWEITGSIGLFMCQFIKYLFFISLFCSIFSLVAITFDRFQAVFNPIAYNKGNKWNKMTILIVWLAALILPLHNTMTYVVIQQRNGKGFCVMNESPTDAYFIMVLGFGIPHAIMIILYGAIAIKLYKRRVPGERQPSNPKHSNGAKKTANKVTRMIICVLLAFDLCWAPVFFLYVGPSVKNTLFEYVELVEGAMTSKILMMFNGVSNAMIYAVYNQNFRRAFKEAFYQKALVNNLKNIHLSRSSKVLSGTSSSSKGPFRERTKGEAFAITKTQSLEKICKQSK